MSWEVDEWYERAGCCAQGTLAGRLGLARLATAVCTPPHHHLHYHAGTLVIGSAEATGCVPCVMQRGCVLLRCQLQQLDISTVVQQ
jgi:hypothetical protein